MLEKVFYRYSNRLILMLDDFPRFSRLSFERLQPLARYFKLSLLSLLALVMLFSTFQWFFGLPMFHRLSTETSVASQTEKVTTKAKPAAKIKKQAAPVELPAFVQQAGDSSEPMVLGRQLNAVKFGEGHWVSLFKLWNAESGWKSTALNRFSGACGIPQALPCSKIKDRSVYGQISWGLDYIANRYGNPTKAWKHWLSHHWY